MGTPVARWVRALCVGASVPTTALARCGEDFEHLASPAAAELLCAPFGETAHPGPASCAWQQCPTVHQRERADEDVHTESGHDRRILSAWNALHVTNHAIKAAFGIRLPRTRVSQG